MGSSPAASAKDYCNNMNIRKAEIKDRKAVFSMLQELRRSGYREMGEPYIEVEITEKAKKLFETLLNNSDVHIIVAVEENKIIGICIAYEIPKVLDGNKRILIEEMVVDPIFRGKGVGSKLLENIEQYAIRQGIKYVKVTTGTKLRANDFYRKHGYIHFENAYRKKTF